MKYHIILLLLVIFLAFYYYNVMEHLTNISSNKSKTLFNADQHECSREEINKAEYNYVTNKINNGLRPN